MKWAQLTVTTSQEASDAVANYLFELNANGIEIKDSPAPSAATTTLISYFPMDDLVGERVQKVRRFLSQLPRFGIDPQPAEVWLRSIEGENWSEKWRSAFPPQRIGKRLVIAPTWHQVTPQASEILIRLDPGMAFGTGHHPTTRIAMELLEAVITGGEIVADIGTGSGILAITAAKLGAKRVDAVDSDATVVPIAQENLRHNGVTPIVHLRQGDGLEVLHGTYHLIVANILTKVILPMIPQYPQFLKPGGQIILSGIMAKEAKQVEDLLRANGFRSLETRQWENWVGILATVGRLSEGKKQKQSVCIK